MFSTAAHPRVASLAPSGQFTFCTWAKTLLRLQVWNLFAYGEQIMRAADCKNWRKSPKGFFAKLKRPLWGRALCIDQNLPLLPEWLPEEWLWETLPPEDEELFSLGLGVRVTVRRRKWSDFWVSCMEPGTA